MAGGRHGGEGPCKISWAYMIEQKGQDLLRCKCVRKAIKLNARHGLSRRARRSELRVRKVPSPLPNLSSSASAHVHVVSLPTSERQDDSLRDWRRLGRVVAEAPAQRDSDGVSPRASPPRQILACPGRRKRQLPESADSHGCSGTGSCAAATHFPTRSGASDD